MFIEQYRLDQNPFAQGRIRSVFVSHSYQHAASTVSHVLGGDLHCLFVTGNRGVGKTTLVETQIANAGDYAIGRVQPKAQEAGAVLKALIKELGLGDVDGTAGELRRILQVYLHHQAGLGRKSLVVAHGVESDSPEVLRELELLANMRLRGKPVTQMILTTRNEELMASFMSRHDGSPRAPATDQRLLGLTLDETAAYLRAAVESSGCPWFRELFPEELLTDIQAFTQGAIADIDALCGDALDALADRARDDRHHPRLSLSMIKAAASRLHLKYDASSWKVQHEAMLAPGSVRESRPDELRIDAAQLLVSSGGRQVARVTLNRPRMILGRDRNCDISLDSGYVSRYQNLFMETGDGWMLIDLNSTNGCFVNGRRVHEHKLRDGDLISLGQHQLRFTGSRSGVRNAPPNPAPEATSRFLLPET